MCLSYQGRSSINHFIKSIYDAVNFEFAGYSQILWTNIGSNLVLHAPPASKFVTRTINIDGDFAFFWVWIFYCLRHSQSSLRMTSCSAVKLKGNCFSRSERRHWVMTLIWIFHDCRVPTLLQTSSELRHSQIFLYSHSYIKGVRLGICSHEWWL